MLVIDLFNNVEFKDIWNIILEKHPFFSSKEFLRLSKNDKKSIKIYATEAIKDTFIKMQKMTCLEDESIYMVVVEEMDPEDINLKKFSSYLVEKNEVLDKNKTGEITIWTDSKYRVNYFGYNFIPWEEILGYHVCPKTLGLNLVDVVVEIFCEMTRFGFDENKIQELGKDISTELNGINLNEEIENARKKKIFGKNIWFDALCDKIGLSKAPKELLGETSQKKVIVNNNHKIHIEYLKSIN